MKTQESIAKMQARAQAQKSTTTGFKRLYSYSKIQANAASLFGNNPALLALVEKCKDIAQDDDLRKRIRRSLRDALDRMIAECNNQATDPKALANAILAMKKWHGQITDAQAFTPETLSQDADRKEMLTDIFTVHAGYQAVAKDKKAGKPAKDAKKANDAPAANTVPNTENSAE